MPFTEIELKYIEDTVGRMCKRRSPPQFRDELRIVYKVERLDVIGRKGDRFIYGLRI
jgi:hypothetical protein